MSEPEPATEGPILFAFDCDTNEAAPGTPASPRPLGRPREAPAPTDPRDEAFARELADRVLEYARSHPAGLTPEQLAALVQQFLTRRAG